MRGPELLRQLSWSLWASPSPSGRVRVVVRVLPLDSTLAKARLPALWSESLAARQVVRDVASDLAGASYASMPIVHSPQGKPRFARGGLEFSLAHQGGWCAVALSEDAPVGVDLEPIRVFPEMTTLAIHFFPPEALAELVRTKPAGRPDLFFAWWTRLEASQKALDGHLDSMAKRLDAVRHQFWKGLDGFALCVAAAGRRPLAVEWFRPMDEPGGSGALDTDLVFPGTEH